MTISRFNGLFRWTSNRNETVETVILSIRAFTGLKADVNGYKPHDFGPVVSGMEKALEDLVTCSRAR